MCSRCLRKHPDGSKVSKSSYFRHRQEQQNRLQLDEREAGLRVCKSCTAFPNGHYTSRATYYRHLQHRRGSNVNASSGVILESDQTAPLDEGHLTPPPALGQLSSSIDDSDKGVNSNDEEEDTGETQLLDTLLVDDEEQELLFNEEGKFYDPRRMTGRAVNWHPHR